jgi:DNA-binding NarL/FixJ family response regulator
MPELPPRWAAYMRLQEELASKSDADDHAWGLEEALHRLLSDELSLEEIDRIIRSRRRRERHQARLRSAYLIKDERQPSVELGTQMDVRQQLAELRDQVTASEWALFQRLGEGYRYKEIADLETVSIGALRARVCRLRRRLCGGENSGQ